MKSLQSTPLLYALLGAAISLTTASKLRFPGVPVGPGEAFLALYIVGTVMREGKRILAGNPLPQGSKAVCMLWGGLFFFLGGGAINAHVHDIVGHVVLRDTVAYLFVCGFTLALVLDTRLRDHIRTVITAFIVTALAGNILFFADSLIYGTVHGGENLANLTVITPQMLMDGNKDWYGWAHNVNQSVLVVSTIPFLCYIQWKLSTGKRWIWVVVAIVSLFLGLGLRSRALFVAGLAAVGMYAMLRLSSRFSLAGRRVSRERVGWGVIAVLWITYCAAYYLLYEGFKGEYGFARLAATSQWLEMMQASSFLGLGPGQFLEALPPFMGGEAHNVFFDILLGGGLLGGGVFCLFCAWSLNQYFKQDNDFLICLPVVLMVYSMFNHTARHPVAWFVALLPLFLSGLGRVQDIGGNPR